VGPRVGRLVGGMRSFATVLEFAALALGMLFGLGAMRRRRRRRDEAAHRIYEQLERSRSQGCFVGRVRPIQNARRGQKLWLRPDDRSGPRRGSYQCWLPGAWLPAKSRVAVSGSLGYGPHTGDWQVLYIRRVHVVLTDDDFTRAKRHRRRARRAGARAKLVSMSSAAGRRAGELLARATRFDGRTGRGSSEQPSDPRTSSEEGGGRGGT
jgi:hypothetical protein